MNALLLILKLLPVILPALKAVEEAIPLPGEGKQKLDLILGVIKSCFDASPDLASGGVTWEKLLALIVPMIAQIVSLNNSLGLFTHSAPPAKA